MAAIARDSSGGSGQSALKTFWKEFITLDAINMNDPCEDVNMFTGTGVSWVTVRGSRLQRRKQLRPWRRDGRPLPSHDGTGGGEEQLLTDEQRQWSLEAESVPSDDAVKVVDMTTKALERYMNLVENGGSV